MCNFALGPRQAQEPLSEQYNVTKFDFDDPVVEVCASRFLPDENGVITQFEIDLIEPDLNPPQHPENEAILLMRHTYKDRAPWIVLSLYRYRLTVS
jgi:hypothetical protein